MATSVNIKMYRVNELGDCFLLTFKHARITKHMLIDCGSFRNSDASKLRMKEIATNIHMHVAASNGKLDVVVGTHQHNDHVSGFVHGEDEFKKLTIQQVWLSWLDNPRSKVAARIEENHLGLRKGLAAAIDKIGNGNGKQFVSERAKKVHGLVTDVLGAFGAAPALPSNGIKILKKIGVDEVAYLMPGDMRVIPGIPQEELKIHVLGPPRDSELLYRKDPREGESYDHKMRAANAMAAHLLKALGNRTHSDDKEDKEEEHFPFNGSYKYYARRPSSFTDNLTELVAQYHDKHNAWRNIDDDWLEQAGRLALYMDTYTNNSSVVLAIELVKSEKVLLFPADAQTGNWLSWNNVKFKDANTTINGLLERTVFYKVGHHASHNATLKPMFEKMKSEDLVAMIPVDRKDPNITKKGGWKMPAQKLFTRLKERTQFRVLCMDEGYASGCDPNKDDAAKEAWGRVGKVDITKLYISYDITDPATGVADTAADTVKRNWQDTMVNDEAIGAHS